MNWGDTTKYVTKSGRDGKIRNDFLEKYEDDMRAFEDKVEAAIGSDPKYKGLRLGMAGYIDRPNFTACVYHKDCCIYLCEAAISFDNPDWDAAAEELIEGWNDMATEENVHSRNAWVEKMNRQGWD